MTQGEGDIQYAHGQNTGNIVQVVLAAKQHTTTALCNHSPTAVHVSVHAHIQKYACVFYMYICVCNRVFVNAQKTVFILHYTAAQLSFSL